MTDTLVAFGLGGGIGLTITGLMVGLSTARPRFGTVAAQLEIAALPSPPRAVPGQERLGQATVAVMTALGRDYSRLEADLPIADATLAGLMGQSVIFTVAGVGVGLFMAATLATTGVRFSSPALVGVVAGLAVLCGRAPFLAAKQRVASRRRSFVHALGALLDFLAIELAAGAGIKDGLKEALESGQGWAFQLMRDRVDVARSGGHPEWEALDELGKVIGVPELSNLAGSIELARVQGATARDTLIAKARELRGRLIANAEADARKATEKAGAPIVIQVYAVIIAVLFVLMSRLTTGLRG